jgi:hypothetical protein
LAEEHTHDDPSHAVLRTAERHCPGGERHQRGSPARTEGVVTDPVYEGKSMAGLIDLVSRREISPDATVLYAHLGGQPAINAYSALFS